MLFEVSFCIVFNATFKFVERKLMIRIVSSSEGNDIFVIFFMFSRLKWFCEGVINSFSWCFLFSNWSLRSWSRLFVLSITIHTMRLANDNVKLLFVCVGWHLLWQQKEFSGLWYTSKCNLLFIILRFMSAKFMLLVSSSKVNCKSGSSSFTLHCISHLWKNII